MPTYFDSVSNNSSLLARRGRSDGGGDLDTAGVLCHQGGHTLKLTGGGRGLIAAATAATAADAFSVDNIINWDLKDLQASEIVLTQRFGVFGTALAAVRRLLAERSEGPEDPSRTSASDPSSSLDQSMTSPPRKRARLQKEDPDFINTTTKKFVEDANLSGEEDSSQDTALPSSSQGSHLDQDSVMVGRNTPEDITVQFILGLFRAVLCAIAPTESKFIEVDSAKRYYRFVRKRIAVNGADDGGLILYEVAANGGFDVANHRVAFVEAKRGLRAAYADGKVEFPDRLFEQVVQEAIGTLASVPFYHTNRTAPVVGVVVVRALVRFVKFTTSDNVAYLSDLRVGNGSARMNATSTRWLDFASKRHREYIVKNIAEIIAWGMA